MTGGFGVHCSQFISLGGVADSVGENFGAVATRVSPEDMIRKPWFGQKIFYNYSETSCSRVCGFYTQVNFQRNMLIFFLTKAVVIFYKVLNSCLLFSSFLNLILESFDRVCSNTDNSKFHLEGLLNNKAIKKDLQQIKNDIASIKDDQKKTKDEQDKKLKEIIVKKQDNKSWADIVSHKEAEKKVDD